jgi:hypothetical protein
LLDKISRLELIKEKGVLKIRREKLKKTFLIGILGFIGLVIGLTATSYAQSAKEAYEALSKIESKIEVGVSYQPYKDALGDAHHAVKKFLDSPDAKKVPQFTESIRKADMHFLTVAEMWERKIRKDGFIYPDSSLGREITKTYPGIKIEPARTHPYSFPSYIYAGEVQDAAIKEGIKEIKKAKLYIDRF